MYFLRLWLRWLFGGLAALLVEYAWLGWGVLFAVLALLTVVVVGLVSWLIFIDWNTARRRGIDYRYEITRRSNR